MKKRVLLFLILLIAALSLIESVFILLDVLPPVASYSLKNLLFSFARIAVIIYAGIIYYNEGLKRSAFCGGILGFVMVSVIALFSFISMVYLKKPVLGISVPSTSYPLVMLILILENVLIGMIIAVCASWITKKVKHK